MGFSFSQHCDHGNWPRFYQIRIIWFCRCFCRKFGGYLLYSNCSQTMLSSNTPAVCIEQVNGLDRSWQRPPGLAAKLVDSKAANGHILYIQNSLLDFLLKPVYIYISNDVVVVLAVWGTFTVFHMDRVVLSRVYIAKSWWKAQAHTLGCWNGIQWLVQSTLYRHRPGNYWTIAMENAFSFIDLSYL